MNVYLARETRNFTDGTRLGAAVSLCVLAALTIVASCRPHLNESNVGRWRVVASIPDWQSMGEGRTAVNELILFSIFPPGAIVSLDSNGGATVFTSSGTQERALSSRDDSTLSAEGSYRFTTGHRIEVAIRQVYSGGSVKEYSPALRLAFDLAIHKDTMTLSETSGCLEVVCTRVRRRG